MQIGLYGLFAAAAAGFFSENLGINLPWWVYAFIAMAIIAVLGYRQVDLSVKVLSILVSLEFLIVLILDAAILIKGGEGGTAPLNAAPFTWASFTSGSLSRSPCCSTSHPSSASKPPRSTARRPGSPSARCHAQPTSPC
jgi:amino acid transporter